MASAESSESFRDLLLRYRGRTGLTQRELAERVGIHRRSLQEWEVGVSYPSTERLESLVRALLEARGLTPGHEAAEAQALWAAVQRAAPHTHAPFDSAWFARLLAEAAEPGPRDDQRAPTAASSAAGPRTTERRQDWGEAPDATGFVGRTDELLTLSTWLVRERCRLVAVLGMGGVGKTSLVAKLAHEAAPSFERVYWRSLRDAPPVADWLAGAIGFVSDQQLVPPTAESERLTALLELLRERRCLLVLDNFETLFEPGEQEGRYRERLDGYGRLLEAIGGRTHQSCLVLTSREAPPELAVLEGDAVRTFQLGGLEVDEARALLAPKRLQGAPEAWAALIGRFGGNGLALKIVGETIRELFDGDIGLFLEEAGDAGLFSGIRRLLAEQIGRSSALEQRLLRALAVRREPATLAELLAALGRNVSRGFALEAVQALLRRSLVERADATGAAAFILQSVVLEYVTDRLVAAAADEIERGQPEVLAEQPLITAQAKDYVRHTQERLIGEPILRALKARHGDVGTQEQMLALLERWRGRPIVEQGAGPGNLVNLLRLLRGNLRGRDLSRLLIQRAYLAEVEAQDASLAGAELAQAVLAEAFDFPASVGLSADGAVLAVGTSTGQVWLWRVADRTPLLVVEGETGAVWGVALSADGQLLASVGTDGVVRLWDTRTGQSLAALQGHAGVVRSVALSADGRLVASAGTDGLVRLWDASRGSALATLEGHGGGVWRLALSAAGTLLASVGTDGMVCLWETSSGRRAAPLDGGETGLVRSLALSADGQRLATGDTDGRLGLWDTATGRLNSTLHGHTAEVWGVALSGEGDLLASGSTDGTVRLWDTTQGRPLAALQGHNGGIWGLSLSADGQRLASGGTDGTVRLWEPANRQLVATLQGHVGAIRGVAVAADGSLLASVGTDGMVRLWETSTGRPIAALQGLAGEVWGVALSADGRLVASGGIDGLVRVWETRSGHLVASLEGHTGGIRSVALSADGRRLASGGTDGTVRVWDTSTGGSAATLLGHAGEVRRVALSADGRLVVSGGADRTVRVWEIALGMDDDASSRPPIATLQAHASEVWGLALSGDGQLLVSSGADGTVRLWEPASALAGATGPSLEPTGGVLGMALADGPPRLLAIGGADGNVRLWDTRSGQLVATMVGHSGGVPGVALSADGHVLVSGSFDGTVRVWDVTTATCLRMLRPERRYERMDITGLTGITEAQRAALLALGARQQT